MTIAVAGSRRMTDSSMRIAVRACSYSCRIREPLLLHARLIDDVDIIEHVGELIGEPARDTMRLEAGEDVGADLDDLRCDEAETDPGVEGQEERERPCGPAESEVTAEGDPYALDVADLALDRVEVEQRLGRVLAGAVAGVDHRDGGNRRRARCGALLIVPEDDHIGIGGDHADRVLEGLSLDRTREGVRGFGPQHRPAEAEHRRFEAQPRACARFVEERRHHPPRQPVVAHVGQRGCVTEEMVEQRAIELLAADHVAEGLRSCQSKASSRRALRPDGRAGAAARRRFDPLPASRTCLKWMRSADSTLE